MGSKSVLLLGIVFVFLLNVIAVHNYINDYYYKTEQENTLKKIDLKNEIKSSSIDPQKIVKTTKKFKEEPQHKEDIKRINEEIINYKSHYANQIANEKKSWNKLFQEASNTKKTTKDINKTKTFKVKDASIEQNAIITLNLNINDKYISPNPIIKKIAKKFNKEYVIKIKIYKYSIKIKNYLEKVKDDFASQGIDIDDIKVIYKKDQNKKDKIKILLIKKD